MSNGKWRITEMRAIKFSLLAVAAMATASMEATALSLAREYKVSDFSAEIPPHDIIEIAPAD